MGCLIIDHVMTSLPTGGDLESTYELVRRVSYEAAECILFFVEPDEAKRLALSDRIALDAVAEARAHAVKVRRA
jgi:hypothetical protein